MLLQKVNRLYIIFFTAGLLTGLMVYFFTEANYEDRIFEQLSNDLHKKVLQTENITPSSELILALDFVHNLIMPRQSLFFEVGGLKSNVIQPLTVDLMTGQGACGSYTLVLARLLEEMNFPFRLIQMKVEGKFGGHIILEAEYAKDKWAVLDPIYNVYFKSKDGELANFDDVQNNWNYYVSQLPTNYDKRYCYEDKRYTNWEKIPIIMPLLKKSLEFFWGKDKVKRFSLRGLVLNKFRAYYNCALFLQIALLIYIAYYAFRKRVLYKSVSKKINIEPLPENKQSGKITLKKSSISVDTTYKV